MPQDDQETLLANLVLVRDEITELESELQPRLLTLRQRRDELICDARRAGAIAEVLADASGINRQSVHRVLAAHHVPTPPRTRTSPAVRARLDLSRALEAAGIDTRDPAELGRAVLSTLTPTEQTGD